MQRFKEKIDIQDVDTSDRNVEDGKVDEPVEEALSPFRGVARMVLPTGGLMKPFVNEPNLLQAPANLTVFEEKTTGESPFSSPRNFGEEETQEHTELKEANEELKQNRDSYIKCALGLDGIGTLEDSYIERELPEEHTESPM